MKDFLLNHWNDILSVVAIVISAASFLQSRILHNENKKLTVLPNLDVILLIDNKIIGRIVHQNDGIDELNIWESKYSDYYTYHDLYLQDCNKSLFTVLVSNVGMGVAKNIRFSEIAIYIENCVTSYKSESILFTCSAGETKANKIYADCDPADVTNVELTIAYEDILGKTHILKNSYEPIGADRCEMKLTRNIAEMR